MCDAPPTGSDSVKRNRTQARASNPYGRRDTRQTVSSGRKKPGLFRFQDGAGQPSGHEGAGIDIDAVRADFGLRRRRVPVHHDLSEIGSIVKKLVADPQEIVLPADRVNGTPGRTPA